MTEGGGGEPACLPRLAVEHIHREQIRQHGGQPGVRDEGLLDSALARPRNRWAYGEEFAAWVRRHMGPLKATSDE